MMRVKGVIGLLTAIVLGISLAAGSNVQAASGLKITKIQAGSSASASEEFIEIYNSGSSPTDLNGWKLEYYPATAKDFNSPTRTILLSGVIGAKSFLTATSSGYMTSSSNFSFSPTLAAAGGQVRLVRNISSTQEDLVGWGTALQPLGTPASAMSPGQILNRNKDSNGDYVNSQNNSADFTLIETGNIPSENLISGSGIYDIEISELLPHPAKPATDANGEFIELYNPYDVPVKLTGYKLMTGATLNHSFTFKDQEIAANSYHAYYITETKLTLANTEGKAKLLRPDGTASFETSRYASAPAGSSWALDNGTWKWTSSVTPNSANVISEPLVGASTKEAKTDKAAKTKTSTKAKPKVASKKSQAAKKAGSVLSDATNLPAKATMHSGVLAGVGGLAVLYGAYEYRQDLFNFYHKLRRIRKPR